MKTQNKDLNKLLKLKQRCGWEFVMDRGHIKGRHPSGKTVTIARTPSDHRALLNIKGHMR